MLAQVKDHDFGTVPRNAKAEYRFEIVNPFEEDVSFLPEVASSCVCSTPFLEKTLLKAHETGAVLVRFNADKVSGNQKATITVSVDKPSPATLTLQVRGYVRDDITFEPASAQFGSVPLGEEREKNVKIVYHGSNGFWSIRKVESTNPNISVEIGKTTPKRGRIEVELKVKLSKDAKVGPLGDPIFLTPSDANSARIPLMVEGEVQPEIFAKPDTFSLGAVQEGNEIVRPIVLMGDKPFLVKKISISGDSITLKLPEELGSEPKSMQVVQLCFVVSKATEYKSIRETVHFVTDNPNVTPTLNVLAVLKPKEATEK